MNRIDILTCLLAQRIRRKHILSMRGFIILTCLGLGCGVGCISPTPYQKTALQASDSSTRTTAVSNKQTQLQKHSSLFSKGSTQSGCCAVRSNQERWEKNPLTLDAQSAKPKKPSLIQTRSSWFLPEPTSWFVPSTQERIHADAKAYPSIPFPKHRSFKWIKQRFLHKSWGFTDTILRRRGLYQKMIFKHLRELNLPLGLFIVAGIESSFTPRLVSATGAMGMWQFIRSTGKAVGLKRTPWLDERRDIVKSTKASIRYLRSLYRMLGRWELAIAAYNCGPGCIRAALRRCPKRSLWTIRNWRGCGVSQEASEYVARFYGLLYYWKNPPASKKMKGSFPTVPALKFSVVRTGGTVSLPALAEATGIELKDLYELNSELSWWLTPPSQDYPLKVPAPFAEKVREYLYGDKPAIVWKTIRAPKGLSLAQIGRTYRVSAYTMKYVNRVWGEWPLHKRKVLLVPLPRGHKRWPRKWKKRKLLRTLASIGRRYSWRFPAYFRYWYRYRHSCYRVRRGDTLKSISKRVYVSLSRLKRFNARSGPLRVGMKLRLRSYSKCYRRKRKKRYKKPPKPPTPRRLRLAD